MAQTWTLSAAEDGDDLAGTCTINHDADGAEYDALSVDLTATEGDNDRRGFVVSPGGPVNMDEGGSHAYTIKLGTEPTADVAIALNVEGDSDITVSPASLTFTSSNYSTAQTVTISAAQDNTDYADDTAYVNHSITTTDAIYVEQFIPTMYVTAADDDAALMLSVDSLQIAEGGTAEYTVKLTNAPTGGDVTVTLEEGTTTSDDTSITVQTPSSKTLTFTAGDWNTAQTVTLSAASDSDAVNGTRSISHTASGGGFDSAPMYSLTATESDSAAAVIIRNSKDTGNVSSIAVVETRSGTYKVKLGAQPAADVTVTLSASGDNSITVSPASLTFTSSDYGAKTVTVSAAMDGDLANGTATITHTASGAGSGYANVPIASLTVTEVDNTGQVVLRNADDNADITALAVPENGNITYKVKLSHQPVGNVTVGLALQPSGSGGDTSISRSPTALYFTTQNWSTAQTVTVYASNDSDTVAGTRDIIHTASGGGYNSIATSKTLTATEVEDDYAIVLSETTKTVTEGSTATYTVKLSVAPTANVTVAIAKASGGDASITASPTSLTFTGGNNGNWNQTQTVTLTAAEDDTDIVNGTATFTHTASGGGYGNTPVAVPDGYGGGQRYRGDSAAERRRQREHNHDRRAGERQHYL